MIWGLASRFTKSFFQPCSSATVISLQHCCFLPLMVTDPTSDSLFNCCIDGLFENVTRFVLICFKMSTLVERIASHNRQPHYHQDMEVRYLDLRNMKTEVMDRTHGVIENALEYRSSFDKWANLRLKFTVGWWCHKVTTLIGLTSPIASWKLTSAQGKLTDRPLQLYAWLSENNFHATLNWFS